MFSGFLQIHKKFLREKQHFNNSCFEVISALFGCCHSLIAAVDQRMCTEIHIQPHNLHQRSSCSLCSPRSFPHSRAVGDGMAGVTVTAPVFPLLSANAHMHIILKGAVLLLTVALKSLLLATSHVGQMARD